MPPKKQHTLARGHPWDLRQKRKRKSKHLDSIRAKPPLVLKPCKSEVQTFLDVREVEEQLAARVGSFACVTRPVLIMPGFVATHDNRRGRLRKVLQLELGFAVQHAAGSTGTVGGRSRLARLCSLRRLPIPTSNRSNECVHRWVSAVPHLTRKEAASGFQAVARTSSIRGAKRTSWQQ